MEKLIGSWKLTEAGDPDTMENYMKSAELSWVFRQMVRRASPVLRIKESSKEPGKYVLIFNRKDSSIWGSRLARLRMEAKGFRSDELMGWCSTPSSGLTMTENCHTSLPTVKVFQFSVQGRILSYEMITVWQNISGKTFLSLFLLKNFRFF